MSESSLNFLSEYLSIVLHRHNPRISSFQSKHQVNHAYKYNGASTRVEKLANFPLEQSISSTSTQFLVFSKLFS